MKRIFLLLIISLIALNGFSQEEVPEDDGPPLRKVPFKDRVYVGGNFGASFSSYGTYVDVSPLAGYMLTENLSAGLGFSYIYSDNKYWDLRQSIKGGRVFMRYQLFNFLFGHAEYEHLFLKIKEFANTPNEQVYNVTAPGLLAGAGISSRVSERSMFYLMVLYNFLDDPYRSPYNNPYVIRVGFNFGL